MKASPLHPPNIAGLAVAAETAAAKIPRGGAGNDAARAAVSACAEVAAAALHIYAAKSVVGVDDGQSGIVVPLPRPRNQIQASLLDPGCSCCPGCRIVWILTARRFGVHWSWWVDAWVGENASAGRSITV